MAQNLPKLCASVFFFSALCGVCVWQKTARKFVANCTGNPRVFLAIPVPIPMVSFLPVNLWVFRLKQALDHPKQSSIKGVMSKTIKLIINP